MKHISLIFLLVFPPLVLTMEPPKTSKKFHLLSCFGKKSKNQDKVPPLPPSEPIIVPELPQDEENPQVNHVISSSPRLMGPYLKKDCSKTTISSARKSSRTGYKPADFKTEIVLNPAQMST